MPSSHNREPIGDIFCSPNFSETTFTCSISTSRTPPLGSQPYCPGMPVLLFNGVSSSARESLPDRWFSLQRQTALSPSRKINITLTVAPTPTKPWEERHSLPNAHARAAAGLESTHACMVTCQGQVICMSRELPEIQCNRVPANSSGPKGAEGGAPSLCQSPRG